MMRDKICTVTQGVSPELSQTLRDVVNSLISNISYTRR